MSVTHKRSEKQIGAAELEALRASIMAEVEAARAETEESIISSIRNNLVSLPEQGEEWNEKKSYITGDVVTLDGVSYTATHYSLGNPLLQIRTNGRAHRPKSRSAHGLTFRTAK